MQTSLHLFAHLLIGLTTQPLYKRSRWLEGPQRTELRLCKKGGALAFSIDMSFSLIFRQNDEEEKTNHIYICAQHIWPDLLAFGLKKSIMGMKIEWENDFWIRKIVWCLFFQSWWLEGAKI